MLYNQFQKVDCVPMFASNKPQLQYQHNINVLLIYTKKFIYYIIYIFNDLVRRISLIVSRTFIGSASRSPLSVENKFPSRACLRMRAYFHSFHVKFYQMPVTFLSTVCFFICIIQTLTARQLFLYWVGTYLVRCQGYCELRVCKWLIAFEVKWLTFHRFDITNIMLYLLRV